jgi:hypothetical protein
MLCDPEHSASCCWTTASVRRPNADKRRSCCWTKMKTASVRRSAQGVAPGPASAEPRRARCTSGIRRAPAHSNRSWADTVDMGGTEQPAHRADTEDTAGRVVRALQPKRLHSIASSASRHLAHTPQARSAGARPRDADRRDPRRLRHARARYWTEPAQRTLCAALGADREGRLIRQRRRSSPLKPSARSCRNATLSHCAPLSSCRILALRANR